MMPLKSSDMTLEQSWRGYGIVPIHQSCKGQSIADWPFVLGLHVRFSSGISSA